MRRHLDEVVEYLLQGTLTDPLAEGLERLVLLALGDEPLGDAPDGCRHSLRGHGPDRQTVCPALSTHLPPSTIWKCGTV